MSSASSRSAGASRSLDRQSPSAAAGAISSSYGHAARHGAAARRHRRGERRASELRQPSFASGLGRLDGQPGELRVGVRQRGARLAPLVEDREADAACRRCARCCHASATRSSVGVGELGDRVQVGGAVNHDLLAFERRIEVRHDANVPAGRAVAEPKRLGRRLVLVAGAERARRPRRSAAGASRRARAPARARGDRDPATRRGSCRSRSRWLSSSRACAGTASAARSAPGRRSSSTATSRARAASAGSGAAARSDAPRSRAPRPSAARMPGTRPPR